MEDPEKFTVAHLNPLYLESKNLNIIPLPPAVRWFDAGAHETLLEAANFVSMCKREDNSLVGCPEAVAWKCNYSNDQQLKCLIDIQKIGIYEPYF